MGEDGEGGAHAQGSPGSCSSLRAVQAGSAALPGLLPLGFLAAGHSDLSGSGPSEDFQKLLRKRGWKQEVVDCIQVRVSWRGVSWGR